MDFSPHTEDLIDITTIGETVSARQHSENLDDGEFLPPLSPSVCEHFATSDGLAPVSKSVPALPLQLFRLIGSFHIGSKNRFKKYWQCIKRTKKRQPGMVFDS